MHDKLCIEYRPVGSLMPRARNPRTHSKKQIRQIAESIRTFGFTNPILVDGAGHVLAGQFRLTGEGDRFPAIRCIRNIHFGAEMGEHPFGMVAGGLGLDNGGPARRVQPRQQDRRFHLRRGHRQLVGDGDGPCRAADRDRQAAAARRELGAHLPQGRHYALHRAFRQRRIAGKRGLERVRGDDADQQPDRRAGIAEVQDARRFAKAADAAAALAAAGEQMPVEIAPEADLVELRVAADPDPPAAA